MKFAGTPAGTVIVAGVPGSTVILKSCTGAVLLALWVWVPGAVTEILFDIAPGAVNGVAGAVGVRLAVMVIEAPEFNVPMLHVTVELTAVPQLPWLAEIELNVAPDKGSESVTMILLVGSPLLTTVYVNATWLPTPKVAGGTGAVAVTTKLPIGPSLLTNASALVPFKELWKAATTGKLVEAVSPVTYVPLWESTAMPVPMSVPFPPRYVEYPGHLTGGLAPGLELQTVVVSIRTTNASSPPPEAACTGVPDSTDDGKSAEFVQPATSAPPTLSVAIDVPASAAVPPR